MRTISIDGISCVISSASCVSSSVGAPKLAPCVIAVVTRLDDARMRMPENQRAPGAAVIEIAIAVDVDEVSAFARGDEDRLPADAAEGPSRTIDAAGYESAGLGKSTDAVGMVHCYWKPRWIVLMIRGGIVRFENARQPRISWKCGKARNYCGP